MGQSTIRELVSIWGWEINQTPLDKMEKRVQSVKSDIKHLIELGVSAATSLFEMARETAFAGAAADKLGKKTGLGSQKVQELQYAAKQAGIDVEGLGKTMVHLSDNMLGAFQGNEEARNTFFMVGVSATDAQGKLKPLDVMLGDVAERFKAMPDGPRKLALATKLLGREGAAMIPFLDQGAAHIHAIMREAEELGIVQSKAAIINDNIFRQSLIRLQGVMVGLRNTVAIRLVPAINQIMKNLMAWIAQNRILVQQKILEFVQALAKISVALWNTFLFLTKAIGALVSAFQGLDHVLNLVALVMGVIMGIKLYVMLASLIPVIQGVAAALGLVQLAAWEITLVVAAVVAAFALLYLVFDDVVGYFQGKDSMLGRGVDAMQRMFSTQSPVMQSIRDGLMYAFGPLGFALDAMGKLGMYDKIGGNKGKAAPMAASSGGRGRGAGVSRSFADSSGISRTWGPPDISSPSSVVNNTGGSQQVHVHQRIDVHAPISIAHGNTQEVQASMNDWYKMIMRKAGNELKPAQRGAN